MSEKISDQSEYLDLPFKALWAALTDEASSLESSYELAMSIIERCGLESRSTEIEGAMAGKYETIRHGATPLIVAALANRPDVVKSLIAAGADINAHDEDMFSKSSALQIAAANNGIEVATLLLVQRDKIKISAVDRTESTALHVAARRGHVKMIELLLEHGADINAAESHGCTPVHTAAIYDRVDSLKALVRGGASVDSPDRNQSRSPLHFAAWMGQESVIRALLMEDADINCADIDGRTPLHFASQSRIGDGIGILLANGANINARDEFRFTPLHFAAISGNVAAIQQLLDCGAETSAVTENAQTTLGFAHEKGLLEAISLLAAEGCVDTEA